VTLVAALLVVAGVYRLWLMSQYFGWEESDYGNLAMARGVLDSGFRHYDMNHLPLYYGLSAAVMAVVGDAVLATRAVSMVGGLLTVGLAVVLADRVAGRRVAWTVGLVCAFQPELALYSASSLREPVYAAAVVGCLVALSRDRLVLASIAAGLAFLTRMDALLTLGPALLLHAGGRGPRVQRLGKVALPLAGGVAGWAAYCKAMHGTWEFWAHSVGVNVETGGTELAPGGAQWALDGFSVVGALLFQVLPSRIGWLLFVGMLAGLATVPWRRHDIRRTLAVGALCLLGFWLGIAFVAQHDPDHNLYWKWLHGVLPPVLVLAGMGAWRLAVVIEGVAGKAASRVVLLLGATQAVWAMGSETARQIEVSQQLYKPQLDLARWIEAEVPESTPMVLDNIPACWVDRRSHERSLHSWFDLPVTPNDRGAFAIWLDNEDIGYVLWFEEEWTQAPVLAPWLANPTTHRLGTVVLVPLQHEPEYGWIFYKVEAQ
jgi:hypothetical protein